MRLPILSLLPLIVTLGCADSADPAAQVRSFDGFVVEGQVPAGVDVRAHLDRVPEGGFGVIADPVTGEVATIYDDASSPFSRVASGEFSVVANATCTDCNGDCSTPLRTIEITLRQDTGTSGLDYRVARTSSENFTSPSYTPASWTSNVGNNRPLSIAGNFVTCAPFSFYFDVVEPTNLALAGTATQSTTWVNNPPGGPAPLAIDGNTDGNYSTGNSVAHTLSQNGAWWQVDLGSVRNITDVVVWNRTDSGTVSRMNNYHVFVSDVPFPVQGDNTGTQAQARADTLADPVTYSGIFTAAAPNPSRSHAFNRTGRYVRLQLDGANFLHPAEVQVFGY